MIYGLVLAAGESVRFPWNKMLYVYHDKPVVVQTISNIVESGFIDKVIVVTGFQHDKIKETIKEYGLKVDIVYNTEYRVGMSSSVKRGVKYIVENLSIPYGIMINPGDVAWVHPGIYALIALRFVENYEKYDIVVASYRERVGHPIIFSKRLIKDLLNISEERQGLKEVVLKHKNSLLRVETGYPGVLLDLDTILDLLRIKGSIYK